MYIYIYIYNQLYIDACVYIYIYIHMLFAALGSSDVPSPALFCLCVILFVVIDLVVRVFLKHRPEAVRCSTKELIPSMARQFGAPDSRSQNAEICALDPSRCLFLRGETPRDNARPSSVSIRESSLCEFVLRESACGQSTN